VADCGEWLQIFFVFLCGVSCQNVFAAFVPPLINSAATATGTLGSFFV
jgi:hypothetical protein